MNTFFTPIAKPINWVGVVLLTLAFWLSSSLLMDFVIMPGMFVSGMMTQPDFGTAGYSLFWVFNRLELVCGALILTGLLVHRQIKRDRGTMISGVRSRWAVEIAVALLTITLVLTYGLSPAMGGLGMTLNLFEPSHVPATMDRLHGLYFGLEALKLLGCGLLLKLTFQDLAVVEGNH